MKRLVVAVCSLLIVLAGCSSGSDSFIYAVPSPLESLDPVDSSYQQTFSLFADVFVGAERIDGDGNLVPGGAESVDVSADGLTYTLNLRQDGVWVDYTGEVKDKVVANDYVTAYERMVDPKLASVYSYIFEPIENAVEITAGEKDLSTLGVEAIDDYTLEIRLAQPTPYFESMLAFGSFYPVASGAVDAFGDEYGTTAETTWYNGPYYVTDFDPDYETTLVKNENFFDADQVAVENIIYRLNEDSSSRYNAALNDELDYVTIESNEDYKDAADKGIIEEHLTAYSYYAVLNHDETSVTSNPNLRKAMAYGFDRDTLVESVYGDINESIEYFIPAGMTGSAYDGIEYRDYSEDSLITYDPDQANKYFDAYMEDMAYSDRSQIHIKYLTDGEGDGGSKLAESVQSHYKQTFGIEIDITVEPFEQYVQSRKEGAFDMLIKRWGPDYADPSTYLALWQSSQIGSQNTARYANQEYDKLYTKANSEQDVDKRFSEFAELEKMLVDDAVIVPFYQQNDPYILSDEYDMPMHLFFVISHQYMTEQE